MPGPIIVADVQSPSTRPVDSGLKLARLVSLASVTHDLILDPAKRLVIDHRRPRAT